MEKKMKISLTVKMQDDTSYATEVFGDSLYDLRFPVLCGKIAYMERETNKKFFQAYVNIIKEKENERPIPCYAFTIQKNNVGDYCCYTGSTITMIPLTVDEAMAEMSRLFSP